MQVGLCGMIDGGCLTPEKNDYDKYIFSNCVISNEGTEEKTFASGKYGAKLIWRKSFLSIVRNDMRVSINHVFEQHLTHQLISYLKSILNSKVPFTSTELTSPFTFILIDDA